MIYNDDYKGTALAALKGNWKTAALTGFVASLFGGVSVGTSISSEISDVQELLSSPEAQEYFSSQAWLELRGIAFALLGLFVLWVLVTIVVGGAIRLGYATYSLNLIDRKPAVFSDLFSQKHRIGAGFCMNFFVGLFTFLWSLLLVIPGIVKSYAYAMTPYILSEHPDMPATEAITASKELMDGNKFDLFCLELSFIGWNLLTVIPPIAIIGFGAYRVTAGYSGFGSMILCIVIGIVLLELCVLFLRPYVEAAHAAFYRHISQRDADYTLIPE